ncbi:MAG: NusG domain II-containing protein [Lachnospiraceae bacterium]|nr:NusG domain II-containing protein [Lachnospiraceae bacterium]
MIKKVKADVIIISCVLMVAALLFGVIYMNDDPTAEVSIVRDGERIGQYSLLEDETVTVTDDVGGYNLVLISNGEVRVCDADCPDKLCVKQKSISKGGESIICLPHKLVVQIISKEESDLDAVTN